MSAADVEALRAQNQAWANGLTSANNVRGRLPQEPSVCPKRGFDSRAAAMAAHSKAGWRIRVYRCRVCHLLHVTNADKRR